MSYAVCQQQQQSINTAINNGGSRSDAENGERNTFEYHDEIDHLKEIEGVHFTSISDSPPVNINDTANTPHSAFQQNKTPTNLIFTNDNKTLPPSNTTTESIITPSSSSGPNSSTNKGNDDLILARTQQDDEDNKESVVQGNQPENEYWEDDDFFLSGNKSEIELVNEALKDPHVTTWRDIQECKFALNMFRTKARHRLLVHNWNMSDIAEKWAVLLAHRVEHLAQGDSHMIYMSRRIEQDLGYGMLAYYAENIPQGPGCNMAIVAFLRYVFF